MRPLADLVSTASKPPVAAPAPVAKPAAPAAATTEPEQVDVITGSVVNGATTAFAQPRAFGNNRPRPSSLYNVGVTAVMGDSAWNARPYSFIGSTVPAPAYGDLQVGVNLAGPLRIPWLVTYGPTMQLGYQHGVTHHATTMSAIVPTLAERTRRLLAIGDGDSRPAHRPAVRRQRHSAGSHQRAGGVAHRLLPAADAHRQRRPQLPASCRVVDYERSDAVRPEQELAQSRVDGRNGGVAAVVHRCRQHLRLHGREPTVVHCRERQLVAPGTRRAWSGTCATSSRARSRA